VTCCRVDTEALATAFVPPPECARCEELLLLPLHTLAEVCRLAEEAGWHYDREDGRFLCPSCRVKETV
jgi:hypothetical protein